MRTRRRSLEARIVVIVFGLWGLSATWQRAALSSEDKRDRVGVKELREVDERATDAVVDGEGRADKGWPPRTLQTRPFVERDPCASARWGDGMYCSASLDGASGDSLYHCRRGRTVSVARCAHGCGVRPPGTPDVCNPPPNRDTAYYLPLACGRSANVIQGHHGSFSHNGLNTWAYDFALPRGTPVFAMEAGVVTHVRGATRPGTACWNGGGRGCIPRANYVSILHPDRTRTVYLHLDAPEVTVGMSVARGRRIGRSGNTGFSTEPHLHVQRQRSCRDWFCQSIPLNFRDAGMPTTGARVRSGNCS